MASPPTSTDLVPGVEITTSGISVGVVIAIAVVVILFFVGVIGLTVFCCLRRRRLRRNMQLYRPGIPNANPSATPLIEMQQSGVVTTPQAVKISRPESSPPPTPPTNKYDTSQMQNQIFEAPGNDEHPPGLAFAQQAVHGSLFSKHDDIPEPENSATFLPVSPVSAHSSPALSYISPVSPLLTASNTRPSFHPRPSRMNPMSPANAQPKPEYPEPPVGVFEAPDTSVPRPVAELG